MIPRTGLTFVFAMLLTLWFFSPALAQETKELVRDETATQIRALTNFHEVVFKIWHTAWPAKNTTLLCELLPEVQRHIDSLRQAQLPGILRDKEKIWKENVAVLSSIMREYKSASSPIDSVKLLDAAERLHAQYEKLVRITRPVLKEMETFHQVLYMIYHNYMPDANYGKLASSAKELKKKMVQLEEAQLPEGLKKRETAFIDARTKLAGAVKGLDVEMIRTNFKEFSSQVELMHGDYQMLEKVFE